MRTSNKKWWQDWIKPERAMPLATAAGAFIAVLLAILGRLNLTFSEGLILSILGLLATDTLVERMGILERIRNRLEDMDKDRTSKPYLMLETELDREAPFEGFLIGAKELFVSGGSLIGLIKNQYEVIDEWLDRTVEAKLLLLLIDPAGIREGKISIQSLYRDKDYVQKIDEALDLIAILQKKFPGKIEARLNEATPSVTVMIVDQKEARISINLYKIFSTRRPIFILSKTEHPFWFESFEERYYVTLWNESRPFVVRPNNPN